jgi:hypothetical protein
MDPPQRREVDARYQLREARHVRIHLRQDHVRLERKLSPRRGGQQGETSRVDERERGAPRLLQE